ncbi:MAG TPA: mechanosensitive ion channel domain-containing protein [Geobacteraceae bacterium]|nr:mechanosensitive ion channel domain-containing protein [Geobacteraceae bacterium]
MRNNAVAKFIVLLSSPVRWSVPVVAAVVLLAAAPGWSAGSVSLNAPPAAQGKMIPEPAKTAAPAAIPVAEIAPRAMEVSIQLRTIAPELQPTPEVEKIRGSIDNISKQFEIQLIETINTLRGRIALATLQNELQSWQQNQLRMTVWLDVLTARAKLLEDALARQAHMKKTWTLTLDAARLSNAPEPVIQQAQATLAAVTSTEPLIRKRLSEILELQGRVARSENICENALTEISSVQQKVVVGTFEQDTPPIWSARIWARARDAVPANIGKIASTFRYDLDSYVTDLTQRMPLHAAILAVLTLLFCSARRRVRRWREAGKAELPAMKVFDHPFAAALVLCLFFMSSPFSPSTPTIRLLSQTIALAPMIVLAKSTFDARLGSGIYLLGILFVVDAVRQTLAGVPVVGHAILVFESLLGIIALWWLLTFGGLRLPDSKKNGAALLGSLRLLAMVLFSIFFASLAAGAMGYTNLALLLMPGVLVGGTLALTLYISVQVAGGVLAFAMRTWPLRKLLMVRNHRDFLEKRIYRIIVWVAVIGWLIRYLDYMGLLTTTVAYTRNFLEIRLERGEVSVSLGDILVFFLTIWFSYLLSSSLRFVLREDIYPRMGVAPGQSYAASSLIHYAIIATGFFAAIGMLGVSLTRVTVLIGALGVGIGFGLQSIVNNFVSGLILLFERPIHVGDIIEFGDLIGEVRRIGMRTSTVHTARGADIIVPNSQLTTERVTNWTLSDRLRRIDLPLGVNYGAKPKEVISILESVSASHPEVLKYPAPQGLFVGYGDSSINFELRAWTDQFADWPRIRSELATAVYDAVYKAGMTFPFPQREVHVLREADHGRDSTDAEGVCLTPSGERSHEGQE